MGFAKRAGVGVREIFSTDREISIAILLEVPRRLDYFLWCR